MLLYVNENGAVIGFERNQGAFYDSEFATELARRILNWNLE